MFTYLGSSVSSTKEDWVLENKGTSEDHPKYCIIEIGQNTEKSPGDLRRLVVTKTPVRYRNLALESKHSKEK